MFSSIYTLKGSIFQIVHCVFRLEKLAFIPLKTNSFLFLWYFFPLKPGKSLFGDLTYYLLADGSVVTHMVPGF